MKLLYIAMGVALLAVGAGAAEKSKGPQLIDLPTALRLAGAENLDVRIAREKVAEAEANRVLAMEQFFPGLSAGVAYKRHEGNTQAVSGEILDVDKELYGAGLTTSAQVDLGEAIFRSLSAKQLARAAGEAASAQRKESVYRAAVGYFDLSRAKAATTVAAESVRIAEDYAAQVRQAAEAGIGFRGDVYRANTQVERNRLGLIRAHEKQRLSGAYLAQMLRLDPTLELVPRGDELSPIQLPATDRSVDTLVAEAAASRPELRQLQAQLESAVGTRKGVVYGPLLPTLGAQAFYGGLGGGSGTPGPADFDQSSDYAAGISWKLGPGGLLDFGRIRASDAKVRSGELELVRTSEEITRQIVDAHTRLHSLGDQIGSARNAMKSAELTLQLARDRKEFGVGAVLETIQAEQDLTQARLDYLNVVSEHNKAQYALERARGGL